MFIRFSCMLKKKKKMKKSAITVIYLSSRVERISRAYFESVVYLLFLLSLDIFLKMFYFASSFNEMICCVLNGYSNFSN